jgi:hypothetical protein
MKNTPVGKILLGTAALVQSHAASLFKELTMGNMESHGENHALPFLENLHITLQS